MIVVQPLPKPVTKAFRELNRDFSLQSDFLIVTSNTQVRRLGMYHVITS
jgi:hypothetical protein